MGDTKWEVAITGDVEEHDGEAPTISIPFGCLEHAVAARDALLRSLDCVSVEVRAFGPYLEEKTGWHVVR